MGEETASHLVDSDDPVSYGCCCYVCFFGQWDGCGFCAGGGVLGWRVQYVYVSAEAGSADGRWVPFMWGAIQLLVLIIS